MARSAPTALLTLEDAAELGAKLREVDGELLKQPVAGRAQWWVAPERYVEVSVVSDDEGIAYVEVGVRGRLARYVRGRGVTTSATDELSLSQRAPASRFERQHSSVDTAVLDVATALLIASGDPSLTLAAQLLRGD